jgi:uncharacterized low-complexity protein
MKKLIKLGLILAGTAALSFTMANAKCASGDAPKPMKCQAGKCSSDKKVMKCNGGKDMNKTAEKKAAKGKCGQGKCGGK